jgi:hypothetical protein
VNSPDRNGAAGRRKAPGPRLKYLVWPAAAALLAADATLLAFTPPRWRVETAFALIALMLSIVVAVTVRLAHRKIAASAQEPSPMAYHLATAHAPQDPDAPSERIALAYELARRRVPANWIAARCALPHAFVELIIAEVADTPGTPRRRD